VKITRHCPQCLKDKFDSTGLSIVSIEVSDFVLDDSGIIPLECENGHKYAFVFCSAKFELLFDVGMKALVDGYPREAVSSFVASLERFYEFYIGYILEKEGVSRGVFESSWKKVSNQSERQLGAYIFLYTLIEGSTPNLLSSNESGFRNKVIHKGYIPTIKEAEEFGRFIYDLILGVVVNLEKNDSNGLLKYHQLQAPKANGFNWVVNHSSNAINISRTRNGTCNFGFENIKQYFK